MRELHAQIHERKRLAAKIDATVAIGGGDHSGDTTKGILKDADRCIA